MVVLNEAINYILSFKPYVMLPIIIFVFALIFRIRIGKAVISSLTIGVGFIGVFIIFGYFVENIGPAVKALVANTGLQFNTLDVGWTPLAAITWSYKLAPILLVLTMIVNVIMLIFRLTRTVNIDIWNYWHFIFIGAILYETTGNMGLSIVGALISSIIVVKLADWSVPLVKSFSGLSGISISTLSGIVYYPIGIVADKLLDKVPYVNKINADPENIKRKLGIFGEPMFLGFIMGIILGIGARYDIKGTLELAFSIAAVIYILPVMSGILGKGLITISDGMKEFMQKKFPNIKESYIGLDLAILVGHPAIIVTGLLLMPIALFLAFVIPGVTFIPLGDLANTIGAVAMIVVAVRGNVVRSLIVSTPIIAGKLLVASYMALLYTDLARKVNFKFDGYDGIITSFLDGGNIFRFWFIKVFEGKLWALLLIPIVILLLYITKKDADRY